jgi:ADP-heptose:LPS heptosyltransferase
MSVVVDRSVRRVLIFRHGSLGDTVVALPAFHLIARAFPAAERAVLTNVPRNPRETDLDAILGGTGLVHRYLHYLAGAASPRALLQLRGRIRAFRPEVLVYLAERKRGSQSVRQLAFFRACAITRIVGAPEPGVADEHLAEGELWEAETAFLLRRLRKLGNIDPAEPGAWEMKFNAEERRRADDALAGWSGAGDFVALAPGAKIEVKDWGEANWTELVRRLGARHQGVGLALLGGPADAPRAQRLAAAWPGPALNLCGRLSPRVSAIVLARARVLITHDSGPMHLAAAVGTRVVAIFSARAKPGIWFPHGPGHRTLYRRTPCFDCGLETCVQHAKACIVAIGVDDVLAASQQLLGVARSAAAAS